MTYRSRGGASRGLTPPSARPADRIAGGRAAPARFSRFVDFPDFPEHRIGGTNLLAVCASFRSRRRLNAIPSAVAVAVTAALSLGPVACSSSFGPGPRPVSVSPGINEPYADPHVEKWIKRFESESREIFHSRHKIVESLGIRPGMVVGDVGSGTGLFTLLFSDAVGVGGKVLAVDVTPGFLRLTRDRAREQHKNNIQTVLCDEKSVRLPRSSVDLVFACDTYHHFEYPSSTLRSIHRALKPGGELVIIDFERIPGKSRAWVVDHVRAGQEVVTEEISAAGFQFMERLATPYLEENYIIRFRKKG